VILDSAPLLAVSDARVWCAWSKEPFFWFAGDPIAMQLARPASGRRRGRNVRNMLTMVNLEKYAKYRYELSAAIPALKATTR